jgi:putative membrane protein
MKRFVISIGCALITTLPIASAIGKDHSAEDQMFVNEASRGGIMEVKLGELAERNGLSSEVKEFGAHMVKDHTRLNKELLRQGVYRRNREGPYQRSCRFPEG